jgi:hypothetical protein
VLRQIEKRKKEQAEKEAKESQKPETNTDDKTKGCG